MLPTRYTSTHFREEVEFGTEGGSAVGSPARRNGRGRRGTRGGFVNKAVFTGAASRALSPGPLRFGETLAGPDAEEALAREAFRRGADYPSAVKIVMLRRDNIRRARMAHELRGLGLETSPLSARLEWEPPVDLTSAWEEYSAEIRHEWGRLPVWIQRSFDFADRAERKAWEGIADDERRLAAYMRSRPLYYQNGYSNPVDQILLKLTQPTFLATQIGGGVSRCFADALAEAERILTKWGSPLVRISTAGFRQAYGFVPRFIAGSGVLSNHAFGLAIDVDYATNPHVGGKGGGLNTRTLPIIRKITGYDFGESFARGSFPPVERIRLIHAQQQDASAKFQSWLQANLPDYIAAKRDSSPPPKSHDPIWKDDEFRPTGAPKSSAEVHDLEALVGAAGLDAVKEWARSGIQTVSVELAAALVEVGMRWGSEYQHSKDVMHFEMNPASRYLPRDSRRRPLDDLVLPGQHVDFHLVSDEDWVKGRW